MKFFNFIIFFALSFSLFGCVSYHSINACVLIPEPPKVNQPAFLVEKEPKLVDWVLTLKEIRKINHCKNEDL